MSFDFVQFENLLLAVLSNNNASRRDAEKYYLDVIKNQPDQTLQALVHMIRFSENVSSRGLAVIMLRRALLADYAENELQTVASATSAAIKRIWSFISADTKNIIKTELLNALHQEVQHAVRTKLNDTISDLAALIYKDNQWPDLLEKINALAQSENPLHRQSALSIFGQLVLLLGKSMEPYYNDIRQLIEYGLKDSTIRVRVTAMNATTGFIAHGLKGPIRRHFQAMIPLVFQTLQDCLAQNSNEATQVLQLMIEWADNDAAFFDAHLQQVLSGCLELVMNAQANEEVRQTSLELLITFVEKKPEMVRQLPKFVDSMIEAMVRMLLEVDEMDIAEWNELDEDEESIDFTNVEVAEHAMDRFCKRIGVKNLFSGHLRDRIFLLINTAQNWQHRYVGIQLIALTAEGCKKQQKQYLNDIVAAILPRLADPHPRVRWVACNTFGQLAIDFAPSFQDKYHNHVLPALLRVLDDTANPKVQSHAAASLTVFAGKYTNNSDDTDEAQMQEYLRPHIDQILLKLYQLLSSSNRFAVEEAVTAIAALATVAPTSFAKYYDNFVPALKTILSSVLRSEQHHVLRAKCVECISLIGVAVGPERFMADATEFLTLLTNNFQFFSHESNREFLMQASTRLCKCLRAHFLPYLPTFMPFLLKYASLAKDDFMTYQVYDGGEVQQEAGWDFYVVRDKKVGIHQAALDEKLSACTQIHLYVEYLGDLIFENWMEVITKTLVPLCVFAFQKNIRATAISTIPLILNATKQYCLKNNKPITVFNSFFEYCWTELVAALKEETMYDIQAIAIEALHECIDICPENTLPLEYAREAFDLLPAMLMAIDDTVKERASRREIGDTDETDEMAFAEEEQHEHDVTVEFVEVICSIMKNHKPQFMELFPTYLPLVMKLASEPNRRDAERQLGLCIFCDLIEHTGEAAHNLAQHIIPLFMQHITSEHFGVRQACGFGLGLWAQYAPQILAPFAGQALMAVGSVIDEKSYDDPDLTNPTENCVSGFGKILKFLGHVLPPAQFQEGLNFWVNWLPLVSDTVEAPVCHGTLIDIIDSGNKMIWGDNYANLPQILLVLVDIVDTDLSNDALNPRIRAILNGMNTSDPALLKAAAAHISAEHQTKLSELLAGH